MVTTVWDLLRKLDNHGLVITNEKELEDALRDEGAYSLDSEVHVRPLGISDDDDEDDEDDDEDRGFVPFGGYDYDEEDEDYD